MISAPGGAPYAVEIDGRRRAVVAVRDEWLVQDRWWTDQPVDRRFYELVLEPGRIATVYRDLREDRWYAY